MRAVRRSEIVARAVSANRAWSRARPAARRGSCRRSPRGRRGTRAGCRWPHSAPPTGRRRAVPGHRPPPHGPAACNGASTGPGSLCGLDRWLSPISLSASSSRSRAAEASWPGCGRAQISDSSNADAVPSIALQAHRAGHIRGADQDVGVGQGQGADGRHQLRAVQQGESFLGLELHRLEPAAARASPPGSLAPPTSASPSPMTTRAVGERREVAGGADAAAGRHDWVDAGVQHRDQQVHHLRAMPDRPTARALARSRSMACTTSVGSGSPTPAAWLRTRLRWSVAVLLGGDADVGQVAEAGRHPVHRLARGHHLLDHRLETRHPLARQAGPPPPPAPGHRHDIGDGQVTAGQLERGWEATSFLYYGRAEVPGPDEPPGLQRGAQHTGSAARFPAPRRRSSSPSSCSPPCSGSSP